MSHTEIPIDIENLVIEDDTPVDNFLSEKQMRLLTEPLYSCWTGPGEGRIFLAAANVGIFPSVHQPPIVPDVFLSLDVKIAQDWLKKSNRTYFMWEFGKPPEVVIEIVSNREGKEDSEKLRRYAQMGVIYYAIYDPLGELKGEELRLYELHAGEYRVLVDSQLPKVKLGLILWEGEFEGMQGRWLRWSDEKGDLIPTGEERSEQANQRAEQANQRAEQEQRRAEQERQRAGQEQQLREQAEQRVEQERQRVERLAARLRALGEDPDQI
jgi:Uma2 family endonuclease